MSKGPEYQRQKRLTDALTLFGWRWVHSRPAITAKGWRTALEGSPGFVDILAVQDDFYSALGLAALISPLRLRGMSSMLTRIKRRLREA